MAGLKESQHLKLPFRRIKVATKNFLTCIGKCGYGWVYKGELFIAGKLTVVAVKRLNDNLGQGLKEFLTEVYLLTGQKHPNLISLLGYCDEGKEKILVYEYADRGSLDRYIRPNDTTYCLTWLERLQICVDAARGLDHLHSHVGKHQSIIHRDIKSANILLDDKWVAKISDLGLSKLSLSGLNRSMVISHACGTLGYYDPEYVISGIVTKKSDVYSFGMVLFEVLCGRLCSVEEDDGLLLSAKLIKDYYKKRKLGEIIHSILMQQMSTSSMQKFARIAYKCLKDDREERPSMDVVKKELEQLLKNEIFARIAYICLNDDLEERSSLDVVKKELEQLLKNELTIFRPLQGDLKTGIMFRVAQFIIAVCHLRTEDLKLIVSLLMIYYAYGSGIDDTWFLLMLSFFTTLVIRLFTIGDCLLILDFGLLFVAWANWPFDKPKYHVIKGVLLAGVFYLAFVILLIVVVPLVFGVFFFRVSIFVALFVMLVIRLFNRYVLQPRDYSRV